MRRKRGRMRELGKVVSVIADPEPADWRQLQAGVCQLFREIGLDAQIEKTIQTPRGKVEVDVFAIDPRSVDKIRYVVECKNWTRPVSQRDVHAFSTVMQETGGNIGFIVSRAGFQSGAHAYTTNTNISLLTYPEFQRRYFPMWWRSWFLPTINAASDPLLRYVEPINSYRDSTLERLPASRRKIFRQLQERYDNFGVAVAMLETSTEMFDVPPPNDIQEIKRRLEGAADSEFKFQSEFFREFAVEIISRVNEVTQQFHDVFGRPLFVPSPSGYRS